MSLKIYTKPLLNILLNNINNFLKGIFLGILLIVYYKHFYCNNITHCGNKQIADILKNQVTDKKNLLHTVELVLNNQGNNPLKTNFMFYKLKNNFYTKIEMDEEIWHKLSETEKLVAAHNTNAAYTHFMGTLLIDNMDEFRGWYKKQFNWDIIDEKLFNQLENDFVFSVFLTKANITNLMLTDYHKLVVKNNYLAETLLNNTEASQYIGGIAQIMRYEDFIILLNNFNDKEAVTNLFKKHEDNPENLKKWIQYVSNNEFLLNYIINSIMDFKKISLHSEALSGAFNFDLIQTKIEYNKEYALNNSYAFNEIEKIEKERERNYITAITNLTEKPDLVDLNGEKLTISKKIILGNNAKFETTFSKKNGYSNLLK